MPSETASRSIPEPKPPPILCVDCQRLFQDQAAHDQHRTETNICLYPAWSGLEPGHPVQVWRISTTDDYEDSV